MHPRCHICGTESAFLMRKDDYDLFRCPKCLLVFVHPQPTLEYLRTKVYSYESGFQKGRAQDVSKVPPSSRYVAMLELLTRLKPHANVLDVGSGGGHFLYRAKERGFEVTGVELNKRVADSARAQGFAVYDGTVEEAPIAPGSFDIVVLGEVIEHVNAPRSLVRASARAVSKDGLLMITTPNLDCPWSKATFVLYRFFKIPWSSVTPPYHLFQFSANNLELLLSQEGFELKEAKYLPPPRLSYELGSLHLIKRFKKSRSLFDALYIGFAFALYIPLHALCQLLHPFLSKDFSMIHIYERTSGIQ
ncbi:MAG: class I SAM-dependent methyltransferase [Minisyncoccia bacterium]